MKTSRTRIISMLIVSVILSCGEKSSSNTSESELINKVNDVMEQMAKQGNISEEEKQAIISLADFVKDENEPESYETIKNAIPYNEVEIKPVFAGCETENFENCFKEKLSDLIEKEFNRDLLNKTEIKGKTTIEYFLQIDKEGKISNRKIRESNVVVLAELARVLKLIPKMKPGFQNEKPVDVIYTGIFTYGGE